MMNISNMSRLLVAVDGASNSNSCADPHRSFSINRFLVSPEKHVLLLVINNTSIYDAYAKYK